MSMQSSRKFERNPSIQRLFPPKNSDRSINGSLETQKSFSVGVENQWSPILLQPSASNFKRLLLPEELPRNSAPIISFPTSQQVLSIHESSSSRANHDDNQFSAETSPSPETTSSSFPTFRDKTPMNLNLYVPLYRAALNGDWEEAEVFIRTYPGGQHARITKGWETALHIAAGAKHTKFVEKLVKMMSPNDLAMQNKDENTALCFAAASGIKRIAEVMVERNNSLPSIRGSLGVTPLYMAALLGHRDMVWYLYSVTDDEHLTIEDYFGLLLASIATDLFDVALDLLWHRPNLATYYGRNGETALHLLARRPSAFASGTCLGIWERCIYPWIHVELPNKSKLCSSNSNHQTHVKNQDDFYLAGLFWDAVKLLVPRAKAVHKKKILNIQALELVKCLWEEVKAKDESQFGDLLKSPSEPLFIATEFGSVEFVSVLLYSYPDLIWKVDDQNRSMFHIAVMHRREKIFSLIYNIGAHKDLITSYRDDNNHNMLHLAGKLAPSNLLNVVSGAALQMQRELLWFKEVEKIVQPLYKEMRDVEGRTPQMLFTEEHKGLVKEGEKWMKNTASSCMLVATLITTVMFAAIFTVPGGFNNNSGTPIFLQAKAFIVFAMADALALFSSVTSILMFLSILTSRYAEEDFLKSLPQRLSIGIAALFLSIVAMLVAFSATFSLVLGHQWAWIVIPLALIACVLITVFALLQFPLLVDIIHSTYGSGIFFQKGRYKIN